MREWAGAWAACGVRGARWAAVKREWDSAEAGAGPSCAGWAARWEGKIGRVERKQTGPRWAAGWIWFWVDLVLLFSFSLSISYFKPTKPI